MSILKEFREFAVKGNVIDLAVAVIIGAAFGKIVSSLVADIVMPLVGLLLGGIDFSTLSVTLRAAEAGKAADVLTYGKFIQSVVDFTIIAISIFLVVKAINSFKRKEADAPAPPAAPSKEEALLTEIRDLLASRRG